MEAQLAQQQNNVPGMTGVNPAPGNTGSAPGGGEGPGAGSAPPIPMQNMSLDKDAKKFGGRFAGRTPDWHDKSPFEERDIDEFAEGRNKKNALTLMSKSWVGDLASRGFVAPILKDLTSDGKQLWFVNEGVDYTATVGSAGILGVEKATFKNTIDTPGISYNPSQVGNTRKDIDKEIDDAD